MATVERPQTVGIREFRENLATFLESPKPVAVTRHGEIVGYYIPARRSKQLSDLTALKRAWSELDALLAASGVSEDELVEDFKRARRRARRA